MGVAKNRGLNPRLNTSRQWGGRFGRAAADFAFPCGTALYNLPANAPAWKRGALAFGAVGEAALLFAPPIKLGASLAEKTIFRLGRSALTRNTERQMVRSASKTASVASERKIVQHSTTHAGESLARKGTPLEGSNWRFPENPADLLKELPRDRRGRIYASDNLRIRPEQHKQKLGEIFNPRHHNQHYHVETKIDPLKSWNDKHNVYKLKPSNYEPGHGTGFRTSLKSHGIASLATTSQGSF